MGKMLVFLEISETRTYTVGRFVDVPSSVKTEAELVQYIRETEWDSAYNRTVGEERVEHRELLSATSPSIEPSLKAGDPV